MDKPYIIAEIGGNFTDFEKAALMIDEAVNCKADAVKLQTYRAETISSRNAIFDMENTGLASQFDLFRKYELSKDLHRQIFQYAKDKRIDAFTTPSHKTDIDMLEDLGCHAYKIGSDDGINIPFLRYAAQTGKPIILATGMCTMSEVHKSVDAILSHGNNRITLLHAITAYPTHPKDVNLGAMVALKKEFPMFKVGYSDHTVGPSACIFAAALGADVIEKHFTYNKAAEGPDHMHSADPKELKYIIDSINALTVMYGSGIKMPAESEKNTRLNNRKSVVMLKDAKAGDILTPAMVDIKRPGMGIQPEFLEQLIGCSLNVDKKFDDVLYWEDIK